MTSQLELDRRQMLGGMALGVGGAMLAVCGGRAGAAEEDFCTWATPIEIKGPFPADGSNGRPRPIDALAMEGIARSDIRGSFAGMDGLAEGVLLDLELRLVEVGTCARRPRVAVYLWQNDAAGDYSLYNRTDVNYLRGLQPAEGEGRVNFSTIIPGCYGGRYPHCHFEVFASTEAALRREEPLLVSQLAFPETECRTIYRDDARYGESLRNLEQLPLSRDFVFGDTGAAGQIVAMTGDPARGYRGTATIVLA
jgi:protocatechuate 3,4-dioxygenase beta subunit